MAWFCKHDWQEPIKELMPSAVEIAASIGDTKELTYSGLYPFRRKLVIVMTCRKCGKVKTIIVVNP